LDVFDNMDLSSSSSSDSDNFKSREIAKQDKHFPKESIIM